MSYGEFTELLSAELQLLLALCLEVDSSEIGNELRWPADLDWHELLSLADHHRLYPFLYPKLQQGKYMHIPQSFLLELQRRSNKNTFMMLYMSRELSQIVEQLDKHHIQAITLKGPALAQDLYGDVSRRTSKDIDLLIPLTHLEHAELILQQLGYVQPSHAFPRILNDWQWKAHHIQYVHPEKGIQLELHWRLNLETGMEPSFHKLWERRAVSSLSNGRAAIYTLSDEDLFYYLAAHGARHGWFRLRWLLDIDRLLRKGVAAEHLLGMQSSYHCSHLAGQALHLAKQLLDSPVPAALEEWESTPRSNSLARGVIPFLQTRAQLCPDPDPDLAPIYDRYLSSIKTVRERWFYRLQQLYPSSRDAQLLPLPKKFYFLYFPLRPLLWLWRQRKAQARQV